MLPRGHLQDATKSLQFLGCVFARAPWRIGKGNAWWFLPIPSAIIAGERPEVALLCSATPEIKDRGWCLIGYPAGDCGVICREGIKSLLDVLRRASNGSCTGFNS